MNNCKDKNDTSRFDEGQILRSFTISTRGSSNESLDAPSLLNNHDQHNNRNHLYVMNADSAYSSLASSSPSVPPPPPPPPPQPLKSNTFNSSLKQQQQLQRLLARAEPELSEVGLNYNKNSSYCHNKDELNGNIRSDYRVSNQNATLINLTDEIKAKHSMLANSNNNHQQISKSLPTNQVARDTNRFINCNDQNNQFRSASADSNMQFMPAKLFASLGREDKKPFAYTAEVNDPNNRGKLDLSQIKSAAMKRRLMANMASSEERDEEPDQDDDNSQRSYEINHNYITNSKIYDHNHHDNDAYLHNKLAHQQEQIRVQKPLSTKPRIVSYSPPIIWKEQQQVIDKTTDHSIRYNQPVQFFTNDHVNAQLKSTHNVANHDNGLFAQNANVNIKKQEPIKKFYQIDHNQQDTMHSPKSIATNNCYLDELGFQVEKSLESLEQLVSTMGQATANRLDDSKSNLYQSTSATKPCEDHNNHEAKPSIQYHANQDLRIFRNPTEVSYKTDTHHIDQHHQPTSNSINYIPMRDQHHKIQYQHDANRSTMKGNYLSDISDNYSLYEFNDQQCTPVQYNPQVTYYDFNNNQQKQLFGNHHRRVASVNSTIKPMYQFNRYHNPMHHYQS